MKILIDTQIFLWLFGFVSRISPDVENLLKSGKHDIYFSAAGVWEIAIKYGSGKLQLPDKPEIFVPDRMSRANFKRLEITHQHALAVAKVSMQTIEAAIDLDNDGKPDLLEMVFCCSNESVSPNDNCDYICQKSFKKIKGFWKLVDSAIPC